MRLCCMLYFLRFACLLGAAWGSLWEAFLGLDARAWKDGPYCSVLHNAGIDDVVLEHERSALANLQAGLFAIAVF